MKTKTISLSSSPPATAPFHEFLNIGVVHTLLSPHAWIPGQLEMQPDAADHSWAEVERAFKQFTVTSDKPHVVLIPEISIPRYRLPDLRRLSSGLGAVVIAGLDFGLNRGGVVNQAAVIIPSR